MPTLYFDSLDAIKAGVHRPRVRQPPAILQLCIWEHGALLFLIQRTFERGATDNVD